MSNGLFRHQFLLAMPGSVSGNFDQSLTFIAEHNDDGAMGLVVNKPSDLSVGDMLAQMQIDADIHPGIPVYWGGPVQPERGFVLHRDEGEWESTLHVGHGLAITTSRDILEAIGNGSGPADYLIALGYAGWGDGQLENEMLHNSWLNIPADAQIIFDTPVARRWAAAARLLGLEAHQLSTHVGHS
ncbi:MAG TPA: YqgE/AlgH family protein [Salinisphaeraceae bacterium]|nr:YqgE/AlgH family protein [Salinisphaeraceae bacterium]